MVEGRLPVVLEKLKNLQRISVSENKMSGPLPPAISDLQLLIREFDISLIKFSRGIPAKYVDELSTNFRENQLSGPIPKPQSINLRTRVFRLGNLD